jgi:hypothetical protein
MVHQRLIALTLAIVAIAIGATPVLGAKPSKPPAEPVVVGGGAPDDEPWISPSAEEQALLDVRLAQASEIEGHGAGGSFGEVAPASFCPTSETSAPETSASDGLSLSASGCSYVPRSYSLLTYARDQNNYYYCGPATAQVIINYSRGVFSANPNRERAVTIYKVQSEIAKALLWWNPDRQRWENTNTIKQTNAVMLKNGLNELAKLPSGFAYGVVKTGTGPEWHAKIITDIYQWHMPFGVSVGMTSKTRRLVSWDPISPGTAVAHWLAIRGYNGLWDGTDTPQVLYNDSSAAQGGGTGTYSDSSKKMWQLNTSHSNRIVW